MKRTLLAIFVAVIPTMAFSAETADVNYDGIACRNEDDISQGAKLAASGDRDAYIAFFSPKIATGQCIMVQQGQTVFVEDVSLMSGTACIRPKGKPNCYTIEYEAIQN